MRRTQREHVDDTRDLRNTGVAVYKKEPPKAPVSWWLNSSRAGFTARAGLEVERMARGHSYYVP